MFSATDLLITDSSGDAYQSMRTFEEHFPYIKWLQIELAVEDRSGGCVVSVDDESAKVTKIGRLFGALILGRQAGFDGLIGPNLVRMCDDCSADLGEVAFDLGAEGVLTDPSGVNRDILYIHELELSSEVLDSSKFDCLIELVPRAVFQLCNVMPEVVCYLNAVCDEYYADAAERTAYDPRSVGKESTSYFLRSGHTLTASRKVLSRLTDYPFDLEELMDEWGDDAFASSNGLIVESERPEDALDEQRDNPPSLTSDTLLANSLFGNPSEESRKLLEDYIQVGCGPQSFLIGASMPSDLQSHLHAAMLSDQLGVGLEFARDLLIGDEEPKIPELHEAFQEMYFAGKRHMEATLKRMNPQCEPRAGETFADFALCRAMNSYYVAGLLYREGHMIEGNAMSRMVLEQIAWALAACETQNADEAEKIKPTKAIGKLKHSIGEVGNLYGLLSDYTHLPLLGHRQFIDLKGGVNKTVFQFGPHSYAFGIVLSRLADYWACVYELTQKQHYDDLENWTQDGSTWRLNPNRPFLAEIGPLRSRVLNVYHRDHPSFLEFVENNWSIDLSQDDQIGGPMSQSVLFLEYPKCSTCKKAKQWLDGRGVAYTDRDIVADNPTADELRTWHERSGLPLKRFFNTSGMLYREMELSKKLPGMSEDEMYDLLATNGMLVKRPLLVTDTTVIPGFKEEAWAAALA